jgi:quercetin dioxygenase-like cupin family protein
MAVEKSTQPTLSHSHAHRLASLVEVSEGAIVSRVLARTSGGNLTLFAFDRGQELSEHTAPFDAVVQVVEGELELTIGGQPVRVTSGELAVMPAHVPHALRAVAASKMLLVMLKDPVV